MDPHHPFLHDKVAEKLPDTPDLVTIFPKLVGELLYLAICTCPDISNVVQHLIQHLSYLTPHLLAAAKHLLCYLAGTANLCLHYEPSNSSSELYGYSVQIGPLAPKTRSLSVAIAGTSMGVSSLTCLRNSIPRHCPPLRPSTWQSQQPFRKVSSYVLFSKPFTNHSQHLLVYMWTTLVQ
ncbi:hypothetical protein ID866_11742 [Astraeus odoratus]|nr:hypothetical protein ID866_11742 [Astraeus odoratus]